MTGRRVRAWEIWQWGTLRRLRCFSNFRKAKVNHHHKTICKPILHDKTFHFTHARYIFIRYIFNIIISRNSIKNKYCTSGYKIDYVNSQICPFRATRGGWNNVRGSRPTLYSSNFYKEKDKTRMAWRSSSVQVSVPLLHGSNLNRVIRYYSWCIPVPQANATILPQIVYPSSLANNVQFITDQFIQPFDVTQC
jgi:hypothetical protein